MSMDALTAKAEPAPPSFGRDRALMFLFAKVTAAVDVENPAASTKARRAIKKACDAEKCRLLFTEALSRDMDEVSCASRRPLAGLLHIQPIPSSICRCL